MKIDLLKPVVKVKAQELIEKCAQAGITLGITSTYRTIEEQNALYAQGRTTPGSIVTNAKGGESLHNYAVAFDCVILIGGKPCWTADMSAVGAIGESLGLEYGGHWASFPDPDHFQYLQGYTLADFQSNKVDWSKFDERSALLATIDYLKTILAILLGKLKK